MGNEAGNKFTWVIKNFSSLQSERVVSDIFVVGLCKWRLVAFPKGDRDNRFLSLCLVVAESKTLPCGWRIHTKLSLKVVNQLSEQLSQVKAAQSWWFDQKTPALGVSRMLSHTKLHAKDGGFLVNGEVKVVVEIDVLEVIGKLDVSEESEAATQPLKKMKREDENAVSIGSIDKSPPVKEMVHVIGKLDVPEESEEATQPLKQINMNDDGAVSSDLPKDTPADWVDVNGFQVPPSQVKLVSRIFKKYPDIALEFRAKNQYLRTACMNVLLSLIETLCQSPQELSNEDLVEADNALAYVKDAGFKVDWVEKKLEVVKEKKKEEQNGEARIQQFEEELKDFKQKCSALEALLETEKARVLAARAHLTLDDFI